MGNILWLASYPKSGSTWVRAFVANLIADQADPLRPDQIRDYSDFEARAERFSELVGRSSTGLTPREIASLRLRVQAMIARQAKGIRMVMTHNFCGSFEGFPMVNWEVTVGAVYVVRNPLDVVVSMTHHFNLTLDEAITFLGDERVASANDQLFVNNFIGSWSTHVKSWADTVSNAQRRIIVLRYEDLLKNPVKYFGKIAEMVGHGQDLQRIERAVRHTSFGTLAELELQHGFVEAVDEKKRFFFKGRANQWREALSYQQVQRVVRDHRKQMLHFGYLPDY